MPKSSDMKKHLNLYTAGRIVLFFETVLCVVTALSVLMVNGIDSFSADDLSVLVLIGITITTRAFMRSSNIFLNKAVLWMAALPLLLISYELLAMLIPYYPHVA